MFDTYAGISRYWNLILPRPESSYCYS